MIGSETIREELVKGQRIEIMKQYPVKCGGILKGERKHFEEMGQYFSGSSRSARDEVGASVCGEVR